MTGSFRLWWLINTSHAKQIGSTCTDAVDREVGGTCSTCLYGLFFFWFFCIYKQVGYLTGRFVKGDFVLLGWCHKIIFKTI